jgi:glycosyltransferase involved in cell wall biosynthesis
LTDRVVVPGFLAREDVEEIRRSAYVQVVPSIWYENAPSTVLEAYSLGLPVLASKIGGLPEIVGPEAGSSIFEAGDVDELARQIVSTWNTRESFGERSKMARRVYENKFKPEIHVAEYLNLINDLFRLRDAKSRES